MVMFVFSNTYPQKSKESISKAKYLLDIVKSVHWKNETDIDTFRLGILAKDTVLKNAFGSLEKDKLIRHGQFIEVIPFFEINQLRQVEALYINQKDGFDISTIMLIIRGKNTLLISENYPFQKSMINFIEIDGKRRFEVNKEVMEKEGFQMSELFLALAIKTEADWEQLYVEVESLLEQEKALSESQKQIIQNQKKEILDQLVTIEKQLQAIELQKVELVLLNEKINETDAALEIKQKLLHQQQKALEKNKKDLILKQVQIDKSGNILSRQIKSIEEQALQINAQSKILNKQLKEIEKQRLLVIALAVVIILVLFVIYFVYRALKVKKKHNKLLSYKNKEITYQNEQIQKQNHEIQQHRDELMRKNVEIEQQNEEITTQRDEIEAQRDHLLIKNQEIEKQKEEIELQRDQIIKQKKEITDSIIYAKRIQKAVLALPDFWSHFVEQYFVFFKPKDIVSGDFYWASLHDKKIVIVAADCTGHGVPGAFMSMLGVTFLTELVNRQGITNPADILNHLRDNVIQSLKQTGREGEVKEGMDMAVVTIDPAKSQLQYAGANNPMYFIRNKELQIYKADKMPVSHGISNDSFANHTLQLQKGDVFYLFTDGYYDQFGGKANRKFLSKRFRDLIYKNHELPMKEQNTILKNTLEAWMLQSNTAQIDDVLVIGIRY